MYVCKKWKRSENEWEKKIYNRNKMAAAINLHTYKYTIVLVCTYVHMFVGMYAWQTA